MAACLKIEPDRSDILIVDAPDFSSPAEPVNLRSWQTRRDGPGETGVVDAVKRRTKLWAGRLADVNSAGGKPRPTPCNHWKSHRQIHLDRMRVEWRKRH